MRLKTILNVQLPCLTPKSTKARGEELAKRSRFTPRIANRLLKRVRDFAQVRGYDKIELEVAKDALKLMEVDELGLDKNDRRILEALIHKFSGGPLA